MLARTVGDKEFRSLIQQGWMLPEAAARRWAVTPITIFAWIKQGKLKMVKNLANHYLIDPTQSRP